MKISSISFNVGESWKIHLVSISTSILKLTVLRSLEKEPPRRATPWKMLDHPWMIEMKSKKVNMEKFLAQVWDWKDQDES